MREYIGLGVLGINEVSLYLGLSKVSIYRLVERGKIPAKKIGGKWKFLKEELDQWLRDRG